jgi:hypothetical protein
MLDIVDPPHGSSKAKSLKNGMRGGRSCGFVVNVCFMHHDERIAPLTCWFQSGCGEEHATVCDVFMGFFEVIHSAYQIRNH